MTNVSPVAVRPSHNVSLSDGTTTLGLILCDSKGIPSPQLQIMPLQKTALKVSQGTSRYDDQVLPFSSTIQSDFAGGRAAKMFETDKTKFYDSNKLDTMSGKAFLSGKPTVTTGYFSSSTVGVRGTDYALIATTGAVKIASGITPGANITVRKIQFSLKHRAGNTYPLTLTAKIYSDSSGPDALLATSNTITFTTIPTAYKTYDFDIPATALTASTLYWVGLEINAGHSVYVGLDGTETGNSVYQYTSSWAVPTGYANKAIVFTVYTVASGKAHLFNYKGAMYAVTKPDDYTTPTLWMNGYRGVATSNSSDLTKLNTTLALTGVDLAGKIVRITNGPGAKEEYPFRTIVSNTTTGTNDVITVDKKWNVAHTTATEYVILGCDTWQELTTTGITKPVTDVLVVDDYVWFAMGDEAVIRRFNAYNNSGTWTNRYADETVKAEYMAFQNDQNGSRYVWGSVDNTNQVKRAPMITSWTALVFGDAIKCGNADEKITGLEIYGAPPLLYVFKEGSFGAVNSGRYAETPIYEMASVRDWVNGRAHMRFDVYLYFTLLDGLERFYNNHLDDIGPNKDEGLPEGRQGFIRDLVAYPGRFYACVDAGDGTECYSSILCYTPQGGWHEVYRAEEGKRIRKLFIQPIPELIDRLWFSEEETITWIPITLNPLKDPLYEFDSGGSLITSWIYHDILDANKWFNKVTLFSENLDDSAGKYITLEYQVDDADDDDEWIFAGAFQVSPVDYLELGDKDVTGRRIRFRFTLYTDDDSITPVMEAWRLDSVVRIKQGTGYKLNFLLTDYQMDLQGIKDSQNVSEILAQFSKWADSETTPAPLVLRSLYNSFDDKYVFIDNPIVTMVPVNTDPVRTEKAICSMVAHQA